ncbi:M48 family peptidase [Solimonas sp. K1W22B-7]|uniref:M48 family metallopeptidase n=1 Tax=Solimonas sp. K1W22B-7 TaxID=2303331 RepID=UPI000E3317D8|nr:SprT family zinc-dependent metalloprotease [Solimonas sp. K1W22B-7]AXQ31206.1 M48 family peptidase [Solimonas sp. K1W22B-7]
MSETPASTQFELFNEDYRLVERRSARSRHLRVEVRSASEVRLVYPRWVARAQALAFLREREGWVREKLAELRQVQAQRQVPELRWDGQGELLFHGRRLPLRLVPASGLRPQLRFEPESVSLFAAPQLGLQPRHLELILRRGLLQRARQEAKQLLEDEGRRLGVQAAGLRVNDPRTQWGSCNPGGLICLSWRLLMAPPEVFRYVVVHELCHLVHRNHSPRFWALVERQMPGHDEQRAWLRENGGLLQDWLPKE